MTAVGDGARSPPTRVLLIGMMAVGKSTLGRALTPATGWPYLDNDALVQRATGRTAPEVHAEGGTPALRAAEQRALTEALAVPPPVVIGVAAGVVGDPGDRERLRTGGFVVWLRARIDTLVERVGAGEGRAWLQPDPRAALEALYEGRPALYEEVAALVLDVDDATPEELAEQVVRALRAR